METPDGQPPRDQSGEKPLPPPADLTEKIREREVKKAFTETLGLVHTTLVTHYQIDEPEACELEKDLFVWFLRFCRRPGTSSARDALPSLLVTCCDLARQYKIFLLDSQATASNRKLLHVLAREPRKVARALARKLKLRWRPSDV